MGTNCPLIVLQPETFCNICHPVGEGDTLRQRRVQSKGEESGFSVLQWHSNDKVSPLSIDELSGVGYTEAGIDESQITFQMYFTSFPVSSFSFKKTISSSGDRGEVFNYKLSAFLLSMSASRIEETSSLRNVYASGRSILTLG